MGMLPERCLLCYRPLSKEVPRCYCLTTASCLRKRDCYRKRSWGASLCQRSRIGLAPLHHWQEQSIAQSMTRQAQELWQLSFFMPLMVGLLVSLLTNFWLGWPCRQTSSSAMSHSVAFLQSCHWTLLYSYFGKVLSWTYLISCYPACAKTTFSYKLAPSKGVSERGGL